MKETNYLTIHKDRKYGGFDFGVLSDVRDLTREEYNDLRLTLFTAIGIMESMYRESNSTKPGTTGKQNTLLGE
tara:strand:+ start:1180 stop:1398 length:219 start_codon:yes stop_codon:yes gene_type:complete